MGLFDRLKGDALKVAARQAFDEISLDNEKLSTFTPFLKIVDADGKTHKYGCVAATNEEAQDMAYGMISKMRLRDPATVNVYSMVFIGNYDPETDNMRSLIAECGSANADKAFLYGIAFKEDSRKRLRRLPGVYKIRETANALYHPKSFAVRTVSERGSYVSIYMARIPLVLTYLTAFEMGLGGSRIPTEAWEFYRRRLEEWSGRQISIGYLMAAFSLQAISENRVDQLMPREGINTQTMKSALHIGNQILVEGVKSGRIDLEDLKLTMNELTAYVVKLAEFIGGGKPTESLQVLLDYLNEMATDPLAQASLGGFQQG